LPQKYDTVVGERGMTLSAGERQRLAVARAFLTNPSILILDEPTAALDPVAERHVAHGYEAVMRGRTVVVITHRAELARRADRVVLIDDAVATPSPNSVYAASGPPVSGPPVSGPRSPVPGPRPQIPATDVLR
jgi:ATP-binding cassette subfamily B protein